MVVCTTPTGNGKLYKNYAHNAQSLRYAVSIHPLQIGVQVEGIDLNSNIDAEQITNLVSTHKFVLFRNQGQITWERHIELAKLFGAPEVGSFRHHPKAPHKYEIN